MLCHYCMLYLCVWPRDDAVIPGAFYFCFYFIYLFVYFCCRGSHSRAEKINGAMGISGLIREDPGIRIIAVGP